MLKFTFLLIWFLAFYFISFIIISVLENLAKKYFPLSYYDVKPLILNSRKSFFVNYVSACNQTENIIDGREYSKVLINKKIEIKTK